jgi:hypothetical protein
MIFAATPAPLLKVTASILVPSFSAPNAARVAVAAFAVVAHKASAETPSANCFHFFINPSNVLPNIPANETAHKPDEMFLRLCVATRMLAVFKRLFLSHLDAVGESYFQRQCAALVHAVIPGLFDRTAGDAIRALNARLDKRQ